MKKFRLKVDSPWGNKGDIYNESHVIIANVGGGPPTGIWQTVACNKLSDIFEEVIEQSDEEWLAYWCFRQLLKSRGDEPCWEAYLDNNYTDYIFLAKKLIDNGFDVKKLRGES